MVKLIDLLNVAAFVFILELAAVVYMPMMSGVSTSDAQNALILMSIVIGVIIWILKEYDGALYFISLLNFVVTVVLYTMKRSIAAEQMFLFAIVWLAGGLAFRFMRGLRFRPAVRARGALYRVRSYRIGIPDLKSLWIQLWLQLSRMFGGRSRARGVETLKTQYKINLGKFGFAAKGMPGWAYWLVFGVVCIIVEVLVTQYAIDSKKWTMSDLSNYAVVPIGLVFLAALVMRFDSRYSIMAALLSLALCPFLLIMKKQILAEQMAVYAYLWLVAGVLLQVVEYWRMLESERGMK